MILARSRFLQPRICSAKSMPGADPRGDRAGDRSPRNGLCSVATFSRTCHLISMDFSSPNSTGGENVLKCKISQSPTCVQMCSAWDGMCSTRCTWLVKTEIKHGSCPYRSFLFNQAESNFSPTDDQSLDM